MPSAAPLLPDRRILRTAHRNTVVPTGDADVAADALADVLLAPLSDLLRQKWIGNRGSCTADQIEHSPLDLRNHGVRRSEAPHSDHRPPRDLLDELDHGLVTAFRRK